MHMLSISLGFGVTDYIMGPDGEPVE